MTDQVEGKTNKIISFKNNKTIYVDGAISKNITDILNEVYKQKIEPNTGISIESQVIQSLTKVTNFLEANKDEILKNEKVGVLYCVDSIENTIEDFVQFTQTFNSLSIPQLNNSALLLNENKNNNASSYLNKAFEEFCDINYIKIYPNLESYMQDYK